MRTSRRGASAPKQGFRIANAVKDELAIVLNTSAEASGRTYTVLRETRMAAVVCELLEDGDVAAMRDLVAHAGSVGRAIVAGIRTGIEAPAE